MILITGATGLVGAHLALYLLESESRIRAIYRNWDTISKTKKLFELEGKSTLFDKIDWIQADILDIPSLEVAFETVDYVYHCAALVSFNPEDEQLIRKTNIEGTANIVNFCVHKKVKKLCFVSSIAALGDRKDHESYNNEATEWDSEKYHSDYAISKYGAELEVWRGYQEGLPVVIVNPGVVLGTGFKNSGSNKIFMIVKKGLKFYTKGSTGYVFVTDLVFLMKKLMDNSQIGERYCIVAENKTFQEFLSKIADCYEVTPPKYHVSRFITKLVVILDWFLSKLKIKKHTFSKNLEIALHGTDLYSNKKICQLFDYKFTAVDTGIQISINQNSRI